MVRSRAPLIASAVLFAAFTAPASAGAGTLSGLTSQATSQVQGVTSGAQSAVGQVTSTLNQITSGSGSSDPTPDVPSVPGAPPAVNNAVGSVNEVKHGALGGGGSGGSGGGSNRPANGSGSSGSGNTATAAGRGGSGGGSGARGGSSTRAHRSARARRAAARRARARSRARRAHAAAGGAAAAAAAVRKRPAAAPKPKHAHPSAVAKVINRIERVIPGPIWAVIGLLALLAGAFATRSRLTTMRARRLERQREELLGDVGLLQRALLPDVPNDLAGIEVSVAYRPADGPAAGGDFYDVFALDSNRTAIIVGDVCGHGRQALAVTALMRYTLRAYIGAGFEPRVALQIAGRTTEGDPVSELTTVVLAVYDASAGTLTYACAGHEPPIVLGPAQYEPVTLLSSPPLAGPMETGHRQTTVALPPGGAACFFTDGLVEARLGDSMMGRGRLSQLVQELHPEEGAQLLLERVAQGADRAPDDMAACLVRTRANAVSGPSVRTEELEIDAREIDDERIAAFLAACGVAPERVADVLRNARGKAAEFGGAMLCVLVDAAGATVKVEGRDGVTMPVPSIAAARQQAASLLASSG